MPEGLAEKRAVVEEYMSYFPTFFSLMLHVREAVPLIPFLKENTTPLEPRVSAAFTVQGVWRLANSELRQ